jgi:CRP-like cAMP-binding protein
MVVSIMGPGGLIGEMGLIDGSPRSATCTATTELAVAVLGRDALRQMIEECPDVAARLLLSISTRLSDHLRESNRKLRTFAQLSRALQQELDATHAVNLRLLGAAAPKT